MAELIRKGRPPKAADSVRSENLLVRLERNEKLGFKDAASLAGVPLATWVRERLRIAARRELEEAGHPVAFVADVRKR